MLYGTAEYLAVSRFAAVDQERGINPRLANDSSQVVSRRSLRPAAGVVRYTQPPLDDDASANFALREEVAVDLPVTSGVRPQM